MMKRIDIIITNILLNTVEGNVIDERFSFKFEYNGFSNKFYNFTGNKNLLYTFGGNETKLMIQLKDVLNSYVKGLLQQKTNFIWVEENEN
jgi:hypothetical protein